MKKTLAVTWMQASVKIKAIQLLGDNSMIRLLGDNRMIQLLGDDSMIQSLRDYSMIWYLLTSICK